MVAKANSGALSTGPWNAIDTDAVDTDRSQAGTLPRLLAARRESPTGCEQRSTCCTLPVIAIALWLWGHLVFVLVLSGSAPEPPEISAGDDTSSKLK